MKKIFLLAFFCSLIYTSLPAQSWEWAKNFHYGDASGGLHIGADKKGSIYVYGADYFQTHAGSPQNYYYPILCKYDSLGSLVWKDTLPHFIKSLVTDTLGNIYCISGGPKVIKYNSSGQLLWWSESTGVNLCSIALHPQGGVVVSGGFNDGDTTRAIVSRCDTSGNILWSTYWHLGRGGQMENALACDMEGNTYFTGGCDINSLDVNKGILAKFDSAGNIISTLKIPHSAGNIKVNANHDFYLLQANGNSIEIDGTIYPESLNFYLIKYDQSGQVLWFKTISGEYLYCFGIEIDNADNIFVAGTFENTLMFDNTNLQEANTNIFILKVGENGNNRWIKHSSGSQCGINSRDFVVSPRGEIFITGEASGKTKSFDNHTFSVVSNIYPELYIAKLKDGNNNFLNIEEKKINGHLFIYPNPTLKVVVIQYENHSGNRDLTVNILNMTGQKLFSETYSDFSGTFSKQLDLSKFAKGVYFIELRSGDAVETKKIILE